jgi:hypothetical protein
MSDANSITAHPLVVQHNALVNARFDLSTTEARMFLAMLSHIKRDDTTFAKCELSVRELLDQGASQNYGHVRKVLEKFASRLITIETLGAGGKRLKQRKYSAIPLLARADYLEGEGLIVLRFNDELHDYLLELRDNFTKAQLTELIKLKGGPSYRIYWLLREYGSFGKRVIALDELKAILGLSEGYDRFNNFRIRVLERAREELAQTDLPFTYTTISKGRTVTHIEFFFEPIGAASASSTLLATAKTDWETALLAVGVSPSSLTGIQTRLAAGDYDEGYIRYVLATIKEQTRLGKIKRPAGAVFRALTDGYLLVDYRKMQGTPTPVVSAKSSAVLAKQRKKLTDELADARNSLQFFQTSLLYTDETRPALVAQVTAKIAELEKKIQEVGN